MRIHEVRELNDEQLHEELDKAGRELMNLRFRAATNQLPNSNEPASVRKDHCPPAYCHPRAADTGGALVITRTSRKTRTGSVVRVKQDKTAIVEMVWKQRHRLYHKQVRRVARFYIHDPENQCQLGDLVRIEETRPISKTKHWRLLAILERRQVAEVRPIELEGDAETNFEEDAAEELLELDEDIDQDILDKLTKDNAEFADGEDN